MHRDPGQPAKEGCLKIPRLGPWALWAQWACVSWGLAACAPVGVATQVTPASPPAASASPRPQLVFKNGFEGSTRIEPRAGSSQHYELLGNDGTPGSDWKRDLEQATPYFGLGVLFMEAGTEAQRNAQIVADPLNAANKVMRFRITEKHIVLRSGEVKARIQHELNNKNPPPPGGFIKEYYQKARLYFSPDWVVLEEAPTDDIGWIVMQEYWNDPQWDQPNGDGTFKKRHQARTGIEVVKRKGRLRFGAKGRDPEMEVPRPGNNSWEVYNEDFAIPLGKWMTQEIYVKEGGSAGTANPGRFYMAITVDGVKTVIVDKTGMTTSEEPGAVPDGQTAFTTMKIYTEGRVLDWFQRRGKVMDVLWDDIQIWLNRRPESTVPSSQASNCGCSLWKSLNLERRVRHFCARTAARRLLKPLTLQHASGDS